jgi:predicted ATPase
VDRDVAIKVITKAVAGDESAVWRFQREARLIARLEHPHILPVYDFDGGHDPPYIVMRYLDSGTLKEVMKQGPLPHDEISYLVRQVGSALDYAHRQGIVHRDVKPSNIMIDREGNAVVTDFGIARMVSGRDAGRQITETGVTVGTPDYMAPEQVKGDSDVDHRADIYALGVILFQMLTGHLPFVSDIPMGVLFMHIQQPVPSAVERNPDLPPTVDDVIARALAKEPAGRYSSAAVFADAVTAALGGTVSSSPARLRQAVEDSVILRRERLEADEAPDTDSQTTPSEQNKTITAVYANAAEYAELVDEISGGQAARQAIHVLWDAVTDIVEAHDGAVFERTERDLLALWGAETAREDDAERAIRAALAMQDALRDLGAAIFAQAEEEEEEEEEDEPLPLKIGIHTGLALLTPAEDGDGGAYTASGATISLTNRLMQSADGAILITHDTYNHVRGVFIMEPDTPLRSRVRGRRRALNVYRVLVAKARAFRRSARGVEGVETHMVGREAELRLLQNAFLDIIEEQETQAVTIVSQAGLGKSRLLYEFANWSDLRPERFRFFQGRATPEMTHRPYALIRDILSYRFEILDSDSPAVVREKLSTGIAGLLPADSGETAAAVGHLVGFDFSESPHIRGLLTDPQQLTDRGRQLFVRFFATLAREDNESEAVVIQLEDVHYADDPSLDLLNALVSEDEELSLLMVCLARPALFARRPTWGSGQSFHTRVELRPLDKRASRALVREILQKVEDVPRSLRDLLVERAEGNPYYMEELVKMLIDDRVIVKESEDAWRVEAGRIAHLSVPSSLTGLLQARLDTLLYPEKLTLQRAAVVGRVFYDSALAALDEADETHLDDLPTILKQLTEREFIHVRETSAFAGSTEYIFGATMMRDLLVNTLLRRQRRTYNGAAAAWLIQASGDRVDEYNGLIAEFYEKAGETEKAAHYLQRAGERTLGISAFGEARATFQRALKLLPGGVPGRLPLRLRLGEAHHSLSDYPAAREQFATALDGARRRDDRQQVATALYWLSQGAVAEGDYVQAQTYLEESLPLARAAGDVATLGRVLYGLGDLNWRLGTFDDARAYCEESLALTRQIGDITQELLALNRLGVLFMTQGNQDEAQRLYEKVHARALQAGNRERAATALNNLGEIARRHRGDVAGALEYYRQALTIARETGSQQLAALLLNNLASGFIQVDDWAAARQHLREGLALALRIGATPMVLLAVFCAGFLLAKQGDADRGLPLMGLVLHYPTTSSDGVLEVEQALVHLGLDAGDPAVAAGLEAGKPLDLEAVAAELLAELAEDTP